MKRTVIYLSMLVALCVSCKPVDVDFSYSPTAPRAGQAVSFTNLCTEGEKWTWTFGDNTGSMSKNPSKTFKKPGTYLVTLMVDSVRYKSCSKEITVYDTVPTYVCSTDSILHFQDVKFTANVYNPFSHTLTYKWIVSENCEIVSSSTTEAELVVYFKSNVEKDSVTLILTQNDREYRITKHFPVHLTQAPALVMQQTDGNIVRQRMINDRVEDVKPAVIEDEELINNYNDTTVIFNDKTFYASKLNKDISGFAEMQIQHMQLDAMAQKWYITTDNGLYVANFDGLSQVLIDANATGAVYVDAEGGRLYWATNEGMLGMPLVKSKNNQFTTTPYTYNNLGNIKLITINRALR